jgi:4-hydroxybenzoyl-CoA thioesterase
MHGPQPASRLAAAPSAPAEPGRGKVFVHDQLVRFSHCDPAGIVYYPAFLDLAHATKEDWFAHGLGYSHFDLIKHRRIGTPTVSLHCDFYKPIEMGSMLRYELRVVHVGNASLGYSLTGKVDGEECLKIVQTVAFMDLDARKAVAIPAELRARIEEYLAAQEPG